MKNNIKLSAVIMSVDNVETIHPVTVAGGVGAYKSNYPYF